jgi:formate-dependent nitrite reductase membrane component NrfD
MTQDTQKRASKKPGTRFISGGVVALVLGLLLLMFNLTNPVTRYVAGVGMVETQGPSVGAIVLIVAGLLLAAFGFCRRLLAAVENR